MSDPVARLNAALQGRYAIERGYARTGGLMTRATPFLVALLLTLPSGGSSQAAPSPGDRIRIRQVDGTVLTGTLDMWSTETVQLPSLPTYVRHGARKELE